MLALVLQESSWTAVRKWQIERIRTQRKPTITKNTRSAAFYSCCLLFFPARMLPNQSWLCRYCC
jgi:hypothetical protein